MPHESGRDAQEVLHKLGRMQGRQGGLGKVHECFYLPFPFQQVSKWLLLGGWGRSEGLLEGPGSCEGIFKMKII